MARRLPSPRPRRGSPAATRARLVEAAARLFNRDGFHGTDATAARIVALLLSFHRRWRGFRASLRVLVATDAAARRSHRRQRVRQLKLLREMRVRLGSPPRSAEDDALLLFTLERVCDAAADGELRDLGLSTAAMVERLEGLVRARLEGARPSPS